MEPSRQDVCTYIRANWDDLRLRAMELVAFHLAHMDVEQVCERFLLGGEGYGDFKIDSIPALAEFELEVMDCPCYLAIADLQDA